MFPVWGVEAKVVERDWRIVVVPDCGGRGLQLKDKCASPHGFSFKT